MSVTASCGHILTEQEGLGSQMAIGIISREGQRVIEHSTVCNYCYNRYKERKLILFTKSEQVKYLNGN